MKNESHKGVNWKKNGKKLLYVDGKIFVRIQKLLISIKVQNFVLFVLTVLMDLKRSFNNLIKRNMQMGHLLLMDSPYRKFYVTIFINNAKL